MEKIQVVCPNCRSKLTVANQPGLREKSITCPKCKFSNKVAVFMGGSLDQGGHGASDEATQLPSAMQHQAKTDPGQLRIVQTGQFIALRVGSQTLGRLATTSKADVKIGSDTYSDPYMSRCHVQIDVVRTAMGLQHRMTEIGATNIIQLNGKDIQRGEVIILQMGDKITLGKTDLVLEATDEEATRVVL